VVFRFNFDVRNKRRVKNILVEFHHGSEKLKKPMRSVEDNGINKDVLRGFIIVQIVNVRQPSLQLVIFIRNKKNMRLEKILRLGLVNKKTSNLSFSNIQCRF
jgi:hypothetical protein